MQTSSVTHEAECQSPLAESPPSENGVTPLEASRHRAEAHRELLDALEAALGALRARFGTPS